MLSGTEFQSDDMFIIFVDTTLLEKYAFSKY